MKKRFNNSILTSIKLPIWSLWITLLMIGGTALADIPSCGLNAKAKDYGIKTTTESYIYSLRLVNSELSQMSDSLAAIKQLHLAGIKFTQGHYESAYSLYWDSYSTFKQYKDWQHCIGALYGMGNLFEKFEVWSKALTYMQKADTLLPKTTDSLYYLRIKKSMAHCYFMSGEFQKAKKYYKEIQNYAIKENNSKEIITADSGLALSYAAVDDYKNAIEMELHLVKLLETLKMKKQQAIAYYTIANWYRYSNQNSEAIKYYGLLETTGNIPDSIFICARYYSARSYFDGKNYKATLSVLKKLIKNKLLYKYNSCRYMTLNLRTLALLEENKKKEATYSLDSLIYLSDKSKNIQLKLMLTQTIAVVYENIDSTKQALQRYKKLSELRLQKNRSDQSQIGEEFLKYKDISFRESKFQIANMESKVEKLEIEKLRNQKSQSEQKLALLRSQQIKKQLRQQNLILEQQKEKTALTAKYKTLQALKKQEEAEKVLRENKIKEKLNAAQVKSLETEKKISEEKNRRLAQNRRYLFVLIIIGIIVFLFMLRAYLRNKKLNAKLASQNIQLEQKQKQTQEALAQLKATQDQLIESERLASLGQLTAGIAHEIRNPLNFVNNFSALITELLGDVYQIIDEMEMPEGEQKEELLEVLHLIEGNSTKINKHGKRAAQIISRMLDTSHGGISDFEKTDINQLVMDASKLAYQGVRGEIPSFNMKLTFDLDDSIGQVKVIHQDLGRVIMNIVNNACQAMEEKITHDKSYRNKASLLVETHNGEDSFSIIITDNGKGMNKEVLNKIFNPFFTTKPAGKGTGLGLTMTYDIIKKMHKGNINVESKEGEFTKFEIIISKHL